ncbi:MAG: S9 family peptidase [Proteobacteria bacterium]|nr:S9 family peptidase [Pseudomonadota bacterium]
MKPFSKKSKNMRLAHALLLLSLPAFGSTEAQTIEPKDLFASYEYGDVELSPDGENIAVLISRSDTDNARKMLLLKVDSGEVITLLDLPGHSVSWVNWVDNRRLLYRIRRVRRASSATGAFSGIFIFDIVYFSTKRITGASLLDTVPSDPERVLIVDTDRFPAVFRVNINDGYWKTIRGNYANITRWIVDHDGKPRAGISVDIKRNNLKPNLVYRPQGSKKWKTIRARSYTDFDIASFDSDNQHLFLTHGAGTDRKKLFRFDIETEQFGLALASDPVYDIGGYLAQDRKGHPIYLRYEKDKPKKLFFKQKWADMQATLDHSLPHRENSIIDWSDDEKRILIFSRSDRHPGEYYLYDDAEGKLDLLVSLASWINPDEMAERKPFSFQSRDGLQIHGYLTLPRNTEGKPVPLLVVPNGDAWIGGRYGWGFDAEAQFFASRGYAVMHVNQRGSGGYGNDFSAKGRRDLDGRAHDDLADAIRWGVEKGLVVPGKVCIFGKAMGGYMVLMALARHPDLFRCGVEYASPVDMRLVYKNTKIVDKSQGGFEVSRFFKMWFGDPRKNRDLLDLISPINHAKEIKSSLLIIENVPHTDKKTKPNKFEKALTEFVYRLTDQGTHVEHEKVPYDIDGSTSVEQKIEFYTMVTDFLDRQIGS